MKKLLLPLLLSIISLSGFAQNDTIFFMRHGMIVYQKPLSEIDSMVFYRPTINPHGSFLDIRDSTLYPTIIIGNQLWMAENLKYLPLVHTPENGSISDPRYYVSNYWGTDPIQAKASCSYNVYGVLYNHSAATVACPPGWHLPTLLEWNQMISFLGDTTQVGLALKEIGTTHWNAPNSGSTNISEFNAIPGGSLDHNQLSYYNLGNYGYWWSISESGTNNANVMQLKFNSNGILNLSLHKADGYSVRCIVDMP